jgi:FMN phosphatase YigB (HAD superfamily)
MIQVELSVMITKELKTNMHIVLDFDGTLYHTERLWNSWLDRLVDQGIDRDEATEIGEKLFGIGFTLREHAEQSGIAGGDLDEIVSEFEQWVEEEGDQLVFGDVKEFIKENEKDHTFSILTFGEPDFQHFKIEAAGLDEYIDEINIAVPERRKGVQLKEFLAEHEDIVFVDDNPRELESIRDAGVGVKLVRMVRKDSRHTIESHPEDGEAWQTVTKLSEIEL